MDEKLLRLESLIDRLTSLEQLRSYNRKRLEELFASLEIGQKVERFEDIFTFKAMNLSGITLQKEQLCAVQPNRYAQIIAIKEGKNINLRYFGRAESLPKKLIRDICEFVLRWRLEKSFMNVEHYRELVDGLGAIEME